MSKPRKTTLNSGQEIWTSGGRNDMLPGKRTISVGGRKKHKKKKKGSGVPVKVLLCLIIVTALAGLGLWYVTKPQAMKPKIEKGDFYVQLRGSELTVTWPKVTGADEILLYRVRNGQEDILCGEYAGESAILTGIAQGELVYLRIEAVKHSSNLLGESHDQVAKSKTVRIKPAELDQPLLKKKVDLETQTVNMVWDAVMGNSYEICQYDGDDGTDILLLEETQKGTYPIVFDKSSDSAGPIDVTVRAIRKGDGYVCTGDWSQRILVKATDLMGLDSSLAYAQTGERMYTLHWQETKGDCCELQQWSKEQQDWVTVKFFPDWSEELVFETDRLPSCTEMRYRVVAFEGNRMGQFAIDPSEVTFRTDTSPLYCTVWPIENLKLYSSSEGNEMAPGNLTVPGGEALCVLGETNSRFNVRYKNVQGYVDANRCMINLPDYLGDLCEYEIANSYESIFKVHGYDIPEITGTVVKGYENICLADNTMLVGLLYPCAKKLEQAVNVMREDGYTVRIYDGFRPHEATIFLYTTTERILYNTLVGGNWNSDVYQIGTSKYDKAVHAKQMREDGLLNWDGPLTREHFRNSLTEEQRAIFDEGGYVEGMENIVDNAGARNYYMEMTNGTFNLGAFLARSVSTHNRGVALDLTLVDLDTDGQLPMQSDMHDLSWNSILSKNTTSANLLADYMIKNGGFNGLSSEWWHFQDDDIRNELNIPYLENGISIEGWKRDDNGWKYRTADGKYYKGTTVTIDGENCTFNEEGYQQ